MIEYKPFVLKCPECTAPSEVHATHCCYCKVPLQWRPVISLGALEMYRAQEEQSIEPNQPVLPFGPGVLAAGASQTFQIMPQIPFRPRALKLSPHCADLVTIADIRIGMNSQFISPIAIPGWAFNANSVSARLRFDSLNVGQMMSIYIQNIAAFPITVSGIVCGEVPEARDVISGNRRIGRTVPVLDDPPHLFSRARR